MIPLKQNKIEHNGMDRMEWNRIEQNRKGEKKRKKERNEMG